MIYLKYYSHIVGHRSNLAHVGIWDNDIGDYSGLYSSAAYAAGTQSRR